MLRKTGNQHPFKGKRWNEVFGPEKAELKKRQITETVAKRREEHHFLEAIRKANENTSQERETIIWLAGLISTDGTITDRRECHHGFRFSVATVEETWATVMANRLREIGIGTGYYQTRVIRTSVPKYEGRTYPSGYFVIYNARAIIDLFILYHCERFFNPRKWQIVLVAKEFYKNARVDYRRNGELHHCTICKRWLPLSSFHGNKAQPDGLNCNCKSCSHDQIRKTRLKKKTDKWRSTLEPNLAVPTERF